MKFWGKAKQAELQLNRLRHPCNIILAVRTKLSDNANLNPESSDAG